MQTKQVEWPEFSRVYCERQKQTPDGLKAVLQCQRERFHPEGWFIAECGMLDSSYVGSLVILPFGPSNTFKSVPQHPISPRGLASDMSIATHVLRAGSLPSLI